MATLGAGISTRVTITIDEDGMGSFSFSLTIAEDGEAEGDEDFDFELLEPSSGTSIGTTFLVNTLIGANIATGPSGMWSISQAPTTPVNEDDTVTYTVSYDGAASDEGQTVSIVVTVGFQSNQAVADDIDGVPGTPGLEPLTSAHLATIIGAGATADADPNARRATVSFIIPDTSADTGDASFSFDLRIANDMSFERDETFTVTISNPTPDTTMLTTNQDEVTTTIAANDPLSGMWAIIPTSPATVNEAESASYTVRYTGITANSGQSVSILVTVGFPVENPASADDIDGVPGTPGLEALTSAHLATIIGAGAMAGDSGISARVTRPIGGDGTVDISFDLPIFDDTEFEPDETFTVTLSEQTPNTTRIVAAAASVTTTIAASDMTPSGMWVIRTTTPTVNEAESARYNVEYDGIPAEQGSIVSILVTVGFPLANPASADDIDGVHGTPGLEALTSTHLATIIGTGATVGTDNAIISARVSRNIGVDGTVNIRFDLPIFDDTTAEADETFMVTLSGQTPDTTIPGATASVTTTIAANDQVELAGSWTILHLPTTVNEGEEASYTVQYTTTNAAEQGETASILVTVGLTPGQAQAEDFEPTLDSAALVDAISGRTPTAGPSGISARVVLAIAANGTAQAIIGLPIADDATQEGDETFTVTLSGQTEGTTISTNTATTTIAANDSVPDGSWAIGTAAPTVNEGQNILYIVEYTGTPDEQGSTVSILVTVDLGTAQANDFNPTLTSASLATIIGDLANPGDTE